MLRNTDSAPRGHLAMAGEISGCHNSVGATGIQCIEARDAAKHPKMYWVVPTTKNYLPQMSILPRLRNPDL